MTADKLKRTDPDEFDLAETVVLDEGDVMETSEFRELLEIDPALLDEYGQLDD